MLGAYKMKLLKFLLSIILAICLAWTILIFSGPRIINYYFKVYVGEYIKLENINVSPKLDVNIGLVKFYEDIGASEPVLKGSSRALTVDFSFFASEAPIVISLGPTKMGDILAFENLTINIKPESLFGWHEALLTLEARNIVALRYSYIDRFRAVGIVSDELQYINDVSFGMDNLFLENHAEIMIEDVSGTLDRLNIWENFKNQNNIISVTNTREGIQIKRPNSVVDSFNLELENKSGVLDIAFDASNATFLDSDTHWDEISSKFKYDLNVNQLSTPLQLWISGGKLGGNGAEFDSFFTKFLETDTGFKIDFLTDFKNLEISNGDLFFGKVGRGDLTWSLVYDDNDLFGAGNINISSEPKISAEIDHIVENFDINEYLARSFECSSLQCLNISSKFQYQGSVGDVFFSGELFCRNGDCSAAANQHIMQVSDRDNFLLNLSKTNIFNPLLYALFYNHIVQYK